MKQVRCMARYDAYDRLKTLASIPTWVVSAACDRIALPQFGRKLHQAIPGSAFEEVPDQAHALPIVRSDYVNGQLSALWARS